MAITNIHGAIHYDKVLSQFSIDYARKTTDFIFDKIFKRIPVMEQQGKYYVFSPAKGRDIAIDEVAPKTAPNKADLFSVTQSTYTCKQYGLAGDYSWEELVNAPQLNVEKTISNGLIYNLMLNCESRLATTLFATGSFTNNTTLSGATQWSYDSGTAVDPRSAVKTAIETVQLASGVRPNTLIMGAQVKNWLKQSPALASWVSTSADKTVSDAQLATFFGVEQVLVGEAAYNSAAEGQTAVDAFVWGKKVLVCYVTKDSEPLLQMPSLGYTLEWNVQGSKLPNPFGVVRTDETRTRTTILDAYYFYTQALTYEKAGYLIADVIS